MRKIKLNQHEIRLFSSEIDGQDYQYFKKHVNTFKTMWEDQGREFWERFLKCFRAFSINCGVLKEFPVKNEQYEVFIEDAFEFITQEFVKGKVNSAKHLVVNTAALAQHKGSLGGLESSSYSKDPFYHKETRDIFRRFFGDPVEKSSYIKVYLLLPLYLCFGGSVCNCMRSWLDADDMHGDEEYWVPPSEDELKPKWTKKDKSSTVADLMQLANPDKAYRVVEDKDEEKLILTFLYEQNQRREMGARTFRDLDEYRKHIYEERMDSSGRMSQFVDPLGNGNLIDLSKATQPWWRETINQDGRDGDKKNKKRKKNKLSVVHQQAARENMSSDTDKGISVCIGMPKAEAHPKMMEVPPGEYPPNYIDSGLLAHYTEGSLPAQYVDMEQITQYITTGQPLTNIRGLGAIPKVVSKTDEEQPVDSANDNKFPKENDTITEEKTEDKDVSPVLREVSPEEMCEKKDSSPEKEKGEVKEETTNKREEESSEKKENVVYKKKLKAKRTLTNRPAIKDNKMKTRTSSQAEQRTDFDDEKIARASLTSVTCNALEDMDEEPEEGMGVAEYLEKWKARHPPGAKPPFQLSPDGKGACMTMKVTLTASPKEDPASKEEDLEGWGKILEKLDKIKDPDKRKKAIHRLTSMMADSPEIREILTDESDSSDEDPLSDDPDFAEYLEELSRKRAVLDKKAEKDMEFSKKIDQLFMPRVEAAVTETFKRYGASVVKVLRPGDSEYREPVGGSINIGIEGSVKDSKPSKMSKREERIARKRQNRHAYGVPRDKEYRKQLAASKKLPVKATEEESDQTQEKQTEKHEIPTSKEKVKHDSAARSEEGDDTVTEEPPTKKDEGKSDSATEEQTAKASVNKVQAQKFERVEIGDFTMCVRSMETGDLIGRKVKLFKAPPDTPRDKVEKILLGVGNPPRLPSRLKHIEGAKLEELEESIRRAAAKTDQMKEGDIIEMVDPVEGSVFKQVVRYNFLENKPIEDEDIRKLIVERAQHFEKFNKELPKPKINWREKLEKSGGHMKEDGSYTPIHIDDPNDFAKWYNQEVHGRRGVDVPDNADPCIVCVFTKEEERNGIMDKVMKEIHEIQQECQAAAGESEKSVNKPVCGGGCDDEEDKGLGLRTGQALKNKREAELKKKAIEEGDADKKNGKPKECFGCGKTEPTPKAFKKCQRCRELNVKQPRYYCERSCQVKDWVDRHKKEHKEWRKVEEPF